MNRHLALALILILAAVTPALATEPNEDFATATFLSPGVFSVSDSLTPGVSSNPDTLLGIRGTFGEIAFVDDDSSHLGNGFASAAYGVPTNSGSIDFSISGYGDDFFVGDHSEFGGYEVFVDVFDFFNDPVDSFSEMRTLEPGAVHDFHYENFDWLGGTYDVYIDNVVGGVADVDFFTFTGLTPGTQFAARTFDDVDPQIDTMLGWFDDSGGLVALNDDEDLDAGILTSLIEGAVPANGMLTFGVTGYGDDNFTGQHEEDDAYELRLQLQSAGLTGDYNNNGKVDAADYVVYRNTLGQTGSGLAADGNGNNQIDPGDYDVWLAHFGEMSGSSATAGLSSSAIPEPTPLILYAIAATSVFASPLRRRGR